MRNPFFHGVGGVLSADIAVPDHARESAFYAKILTTGDNPLWRDDLMNNQGTPIIGLGERIPEYNFLPLQWMPHFQVADVATSVSHAIDLGGKALMHSKTEEGQSQWAVLTDHDGAGFGVMPVVPVASDSKAKKQRFGYISWLSLTASNASQSSNFYQQVVGWKPETIEAGDNDGRSAIVEMRIDSDNAAAEIRQNGGKQTKIPSVWLIHLPVDNLTESLRFVIEGGGEIISTKLAEKYAIIRDPVGVCLALRSG